MYSDPISDLLTRIRNASLAKKHDVMVPYSKLKFALAEICARKGLWSVWKKLKTGMVPSASHCSMTAIGRKLCALSA